MPIIRVDMFEGRTVDQKRELVRDLTDCFIRICGGKPQSVQVLIAEYDKEDWGTAGELNADKVA